MTLAAWRATCDRLLSFRQAMTDNEQRQPAIDVQAQGAALSVNELSLDLADGRPLLQGASLNVVPGDRLMLSGRSGSGKSTLLRAMGGLWPQGGGAICMPNERALPAANLPWRPDHVKRNRRAEPLWSPLPAIALPTAATR